jgi:hypothetical protein
MAKHEMSPTVSGPSSESDATPHADPRGNGKENYVSSEDLIRMRAYELYVERGMQPGNGLGDWLEAERQFHERV